MNIQVGQRYRTPFDPWGLVEVIFISEPHRETHGRAMAQVQYVGDHPHGYAAGAIGWYFADELRPDEDLPF